MPLIGHSLACARLCPEIDRCIVSTDSQAIRDVVLSLGGDVPFERPAEIARDETPMMPVLKHALQKIEQQEGREYGSLALLDPTSPGRFPADVARAVELLEGNEAAVGVVACSRPHFNPLWVGVFERDGVLAPAFPNESGKVRRQDLPPFYRINGSLYLWKTSFLRSAPDSNWIAAGPHLLLEIPEARAFSIDDLQEFETADHLIRAGLIQLPWRVA